MARLSLVAVVASMLSGCLVDDPPPYNAPKQTPPRLDYRGALPLLDQVIVAKDLDDLVFRMPVTSEDAGDKLTGLLLLDYAGGRSVPLFVQKLDASTSDDHSRSFQIPWTVARVDPGCHRLTLRVTHSSNIDDETYPEVFDKSDLAEAYWWANVDTAPAQGVTLVDCPQASRGTQ